MRVYYVIENGNIYSFYLVVKRPWNCGSNSTETGIGRISYLSGCLFLWFNLLWRNYAMRDHSTVRPVFKDLRYRNNLAIFIRIAQEVVFQSKMRV